MQFAPSEDGRVAGYTLHVGRSPGVYESEFDLGSPPDAGGQIVYALDLEDSVDTFVALRAYDDQGSLSVFSNEIRVAAVTQPIPDPDPSPDPPPTPDPGPIPDPEPDPDPEPTPTPDPDPDPDPEPSPAPPDLEPLFFEDFEGTAPGSAPTGWLDTVVADQPFVATGLFAVVDDPGAGRVFQTFATTADFYSHYATPESTEWWNYDYSGRLLIDHPRAGIGVTVLSEHPYSDSYLSVRRDQDRGTFHFAAQEDSGSQVCVGVTETDVEPSPNQWYHFRFRAVDEQDATRVLFRVWSSTDAEPADWQIDCRWAAWVDPVGRPGVWASGPGAKAWDDLGASWLPDDSRPEPSPSPPAICEADYDRDGIVDVFDFQIFTDGFGSSSGDERFFAAGDHDGDGRVGLSDFEFFLSNMDCGLRASAPR